MEGVLRAYSCGGQYGWGIAIRRYKVALNRNPHDLIVRDIIRMQIYMLLMLEYMCQAAIIYTTRRFNHHTTCYARSNCMRPGTNPMPVSSFHESCRSVCSSESVDFGRQCLNGEWLGYRVIEARVQHLVSQVPGKSSST